MGKGIFLLVLGMTVSSCMHIQRSPESGYAIDGFTYKPSETSGLSLNNINLDKILAEQGLNRDDLNTVEGLSKVKQALEIKNHEMVFSDDRERRQYYKSMPWFKSDSERLEFLKQNGYYARQSWLRKNSIGKRPLDLDSETEDLISAKDIAIGMPNDLVKRSWGNPDSVDVAGNPIYGNERWRYKRYTPSSEGYKLQSRVVYFEAGKVVGWEQIDH